jgi:hypothetical protein
MMGLGDERQRNTLYGLQLLLCLIQHRIMRTYGTMEVYIQAVSYYNWLSTECQDQATFPFPAKGIQSAVPNAQGSVHVSGTDGTLPRTQLSDCFI